MIRDIRYQAAIIDNRQILLIQHHEHASGRSYWLLPGGGREKDESPEQCLIREVQEETGLMITIERLLLTPPLRVMYTSVSTHISAARLHLWPVLA